MGWRPFIAGQILQAFVSRVGPAGTDPESIHNQVHALNESVQRQLEEADRRYIELCKRDERDKK